MVQCGRKRLLQPARSKDVLQLLAGMANGDKCVSLTEASGSRQRPSAKCAVCLSVRGLPGLGSSHGATLQPAKRLRLPAGLCRGERGIHLHIRVGFLGLFWVFSNPLAEGYWFRLTLPGLKGNMGRGPA